MGPNRIHMTELRAPAEPDHLMPKGQRFYRTCNLRRHQCSERPILRCTENYYQGLTRSNAKWHETTSTLTYIREEWDKAGLGHMPQACIWSCPDEGDTATTNAGFVLDDLYYFDSFGGLGHHEPEDLLYLKPLPLPREESLANSTPRIDVEKVYPALQRFLDTFFWSKHVPESFRLSGWTKRGLAGHVSTTTLLRELNLTPDEASPSTMRRETCLLQQETMPDTPIALDSGCSVSITPHLEDFVGDLRNTNDKEMHGLSDSVEIQGEGVVEWTIRDVCGNVGMVRTRASTSSAT